MPIVPTGIHSFFEILIIIGISQGLSAASCFNPKRKKKQKGF
jgi:hypothetical protein